MDKNLENLEKYIIWAIALIFPIIVLPIFPNYYVTPKLVVLTFGLGLLLLTKAARILASQKIDIFQGTFDFPILLLGVAYLVSAILRTPNKMEAFFLPGMATLVIAGVLYYFLINQNQEAKKKLPDWFLYSGAVVSLISLPAIFGVYAKIPQLPQFMKETTFTLFGGNLPVFMFLIFLVPLALGKVISENKAANKAVGGILLFVITIGVAANLYNILPGKASSPRSPGLNVSWNVAVDSLKESPLFGIGPANYLTAFNRFRPLAFNQTDNWQLRFSSASNFYLTALTETGFLGLAAMILLVIVAYRFIQQEIHEKRLVDWDITSDPNLVTLVVIFILLFFHSGELSLLIPLFAFLAVNSKAHKATLNFQAQSGDGAQKFASILPSALVAFPIVAVTIAYGFFASKALVAETTFKKSLDAVARNDGTAAYNLMSGAIRQNPRVDRYRASFSQLNFALANSIAQKPEGQEITQEERDTITQLIQQSVAEGKATVALNPQRAASWSLLAGLYRSIMAFAQGSDQFAIQTYSQAVALDPLDTNLRIALGGVYFALGDYDNAIDTFKLAVLTKPDFANARYNLAVAYREKGDIDKAIAEMTNVLSLVDKNTQDWQTAKSELEALEAKKPVKSPEPGQVETPESLTPPQPSATPVVEPPIKLPEEAAPPEPQVTPEPTVETSPTPVAP